MCIKALLILCLGTFVAADLRMSSTPRHGYQLVNQGTTRWNFRNQPWHHRYMEPSTFKYKGLANQKRRNYDNFLRSNIDNEQDNRNFNSEYGRDHLPFRTFETAVVAEYDWYYDPNRRRHSIAQKPIELSLEKTVKPGETKNVPLRWNNPHASEMEINVWIFEHGGKTPIVIPIRRPSCSGEGYQDNVISFTVPEDFGKLGAKIPGFTGCKEDSKPMCTLQIYSHSVESRTYAIGFPIVIPGHDASLKAIDTKGIQDASKDPWFDLSGLRDICRPATDPSATISESVPRWARQVSDVYNHAYQNSDYSPYSGQQHESISKNLQASAINKMVTGNRGELGKSILTRKASSQLKYLRALESRIYKNYEALANGIIKKLGSKMKSSGTIGVQKTANCFRCKDTGSTNTKRLQTNTYIPSFQLPNELVSEARGLVPAKYAGLITESGLVQIYVAALTDLLPFFYQARFLGIQYQEAAVKSTTATMPDAKNFLKRNKDNKLDGGKYASLVAKHAFVEKRGCPKQCLYWNAGKSLLQASQDQPETTVVKAASCTGNDCKSVAVCPSGLSVIKCEVHPPTMRWADGVFVSTNACHAIGASSRTRIAAVATCAKKKVSVSVSSSMFRDRQEVAASCLGKPILGCYCYSPWTSCPGGIGILPVSGPMCKQKIGKSSGHRRRNVGSGAGAKIYALCGEEEEGAPKNGSGSPAVPEQISIKAQPCRGNDCKSEANCPSGYSVVKCQSEPLHSGDGFSLTPQRCTAHGATSSSTISAMAICSLKKTFVAVSAKLYEDGKELVASCPEGESPIGCYCHSPWVSCWQTHFAPSGSQCKQKIGKSSHHRRRGTERGAGAKVYALCGNGIDVPPDTYELPIVYNSKGTNITGECEPCAQFFGSPLGEPPVSSIASDIIGGGGQEPSNVDRKLRLDDNPDNRAAFIQTAPPSRRRRRSALVQKHGQEKDA